MFTKKQPLAAKNRIKSMINTAKKQCWMFPTVFALVIGTGFSSAASFTNSWLLIECQDRNKVVFGLSECCYLNGTVDTDKIHCRDSEDSQNWLYSIRFLIYSALTLIFMTTLATSLLACTPPNGKTAGLAMGVAGISFVPAMMLLIVLMNMVAVQARHESLTKSLDIIHKTLNFNCDPIKSTRGIETGISLTFCGVAAVFMACASLWSFALSCFMKANFKGRDVSEYGAGTSTKLGWRSTIQGDTNYNQAAVWNEDFELGGSERRGSERKNSMFVNDSIIHMFGT